MIAECVRTGMDGINVVRLEKDSSAVSGRIFFLCFYDDE